jgi:hypothetical protein
VSAARDALRSALEYVETDHVVTKQAADSFADECAAALFSPVEPPEVPDPLDLRSPWTGSDGRVWVEMLIDRRGRALSGVEEDGTFHQWGTGEELHRAAVAAHEGRARETGRG